MDLRLKEFSKKALKHLFVGSQLDGVKFGVGPGSILIRFMHYTSNQDPDELWINIESKWTVFSTDIKDFPVSENQLRI
ncbi:hypothetical protein FS935_00510 [Metabacillus litoralis]|uniref:Uncharacterized protein n=1 Tax=Metabacillus litoralis TaxID=152268 RepID=A0A5C6W451_9BACI|nr:hypothetical protein [Metabacillus litoralis]TXC92727.1 hypothetical protein FS935_00510 [Metabacillus litoralis]